jgi:cobalt-zinc-cadmium efflux system protein
MITVASIAVVINGLITFWLHHEAKGDLNIRSAYIHMVGDALSAVGVVIAGIVIRLTGSPLVDPIASLLIGSFILWSSWGIMKDAVEVLMDTVPKGISLLELEKSLKNLNGVIGVHDLHVWSVASGMIACSCHIAVAEQTIRSGQQVLREAVNILKKTYGVGHTTIQIEVEGCAPDEMYCSLNPKHEH